MPAAHTRRSLPSRALALALMFVAFACLLKLPTLRFAHDEPDEVVYWSVADNLLERGSYSLRGARILDSLSPGIYDRPLFHHPPLYPALLLPFVALEARQAAVLLSWLGHALCIVAVSLIGAALLERRGVEATSAALWIPLLGVTTDPLLVHVSRKLWIDGLLAGLGALGIALVYLGLLRRRRRGWLLAAGIVVGLAALAKLPALLSGLVAAPLIVATDRPLRERVVDLLWFGAPVALLVSPWVVTFWAVYGVPTPTWLRPDEQALANYPFIAAAVARPWYYYGIKLLVGQPVVLFALVPYAAAAARRLDVAGWTPLGWFLLILAVATLQGAGGYGFQMRYLAPLVPAIYAMLACHAAPEGRARRWLQPALVLAITFAAMPGTLYLLTPRRDELVGLLELAGLLRF